MLYNKIYCFPIYCVYQPFYHLLFSVQYYQFTIIYWPALYYVLPIISVIILYRGYIYSLN